MRLTSLSLNSDCYCTSCITASDSWPTDVSWASQMLEVHQTHRGSDAPCTVLGWVCCNPHSADKAHQPNKRSLNTDLCTKGKGADHNQRRKLTHESNSFQTHLLKAIVLVTVWAVPAVPVPIGDDGVLVTEPAVHICVDRLFSVQKKDTNKLLFEKNMTLFFLVVWAIIIIETYCPEVGLTVYS